MEALQWLEKRMDTRRPVDARGEAVGHAPCGLATRILGGKTVRVDMMAHGGGEPKKKAHILYFRIGDRPGRATGGKKSRSPSHRKSSFCRRKNG